VVEGTIPERVNTELGEATIGRVRAQHATKEYTCPLCDELIPIGEEHLIVVPIVMARLRRHVHTDCLTANLQYMDSIRIHPKEPNIARYYF
jgi:hypothetical protein